MGAWGQVLLILGLIVVGGWLAGSEMALVSLREGQLTRLEESGGRGLRLARLVRDPNRFMSAVQVGITLAGFLAASAGGAYFAGMLDDHLGFLGGAAPAVALVVVTLVISYASLVLGELAPKRLALQRSEQWGLRSVRALTAISTLFSPFIWILSRSTDVVVRLLGGDPSMAKEEMSHEELRDLVESQEAFTPEQREIIGGAFEAASRTLREVVVPRRDVVTLDVTTPVADAIAVLCETGHMRAPVVSGSLDDVVGTVHLATLVGAEGTAGDVASPAVVLPESVEVLDALRRLREEHQHLAIVIDEHGAVEGIVTLEDLLEEIVGEIYDEFDLDSAPVRPLRDGSYELKGNYPIHDLRDLGIELTEGRYTTIAGLVLDRLGRLGERGDRVHTDGWDIEVLETERLAITRVRLTPAPGTIPGAAAGARRMTVPRGDR